ncbi:MAG: MBL fold metallo-hydrolase [Clostridia bacterium]|nr:MBL fold metallo-hydrolase [Clostridia bacterium]
MAYSIGAAIPFGLFEAPIPPKAEALRLGFGDVDAVLSSYAQQLQCVELRTVRAHSDPRLVAHAVKQLRERGLTVTIHGTLDEVDAFFAPYAELLTLDWQPLYNVTVHPAASHDETVRLLHAICSQIEQNGYPFFITLENQRITEKKPFGLCEEIAEVVNQVDSEHLGICFDFGHQLSNTNKEIADPVTDRFLSQVRHTHIHSYYEGRTHFPLDHGTTALDQNLMALAAHQFDGVLSLELSAERYAEQIPIRESFEHSVMILKTAATLTENKAHAITFYQNEYLAAMRAAKQQFDEAENAVTLVGPSAYVMKFGDTRIAVDIAPNVLSLGEDEQAFLADWINGFDAYILSHAHKDHYDPAFLSKLSPHIVTLVPDFMVSETPQAVHTTPGFERTFGDVTVTVFESGHKHGIAGVQEYGFSIRYRGETYVFPCDVRNFTFPFPAFENVRYLFAHLWLGKANALNLYDNPTIDAFCTFLKQFKFKDCYLAHLEDIHRPLNDMWSAVHVQAVTQKLPNVRPFSVGDVLKF